MRKIHEHRFASDAEALAYIKSANWDYIGRRGLFRKFDYYRGSSFYEIAGDLDHREYETRFGLKLFPGGYVSLHALYDSSGSKPLGMSKLPDLLWPSEDSRSFSKKMCAKVNEVLEDDGANLAVAFEDDPSSFGLYVPGQRGDVAKISSPLLAIDYDPERKGLSPRAEKILYRAVNGHW